MPVLLNPESTFKVWLKSDESTATDKRPVFLFRPRTSRYDEKILSLNDSIEDESADAAETLRQIRCIIADHLVGWRNMGEFEFNKDMAHDMLADLLTSEETKELFESMCRNGMPTASDLGKSDAQS